MTVAKIDRRAEHRDMLANFTLELAEALGGEADVSNLLESSNFAIGRARIALPTVHPDAELLLLFDGYRSEGRVEISRLFTQVGFDGQRVMPSSVLPFDSDDDGHRSMSAAYARSASTIAREIERKLVPGYAELLVMIREHIAAAQRKNEVRNGIAQRLCMALNVVGDQRIINSYGKRIDEYINGRRVSMTVNHDGSVCLEMGNVPAEVATQMLSLFANIGK